MPGRDDVARTSVLIDDARGAADQRGRRVVFSSDAPWVISTKAAIGRSNPDDR